jgi:hypothetical protein
VKGGNRFFVGEGPGSRSRPLSRCRFCRNRGIVPPVLLSLFLLSPYPFPTPGLEGRGPETALQSQYRVVENPGELEVGFSSAELDLLEKLNRADRDHLPGLDSLVVPNRFHEDPLDHAPLPRQVEQLASEPKAIVVHQPGQVFGAYEDGGLVRWGPVSTGRAEYPTPSGRHALTWRSRGRHSTVNPEWYMEWYFNFHNERGISFHQYALPGYPASHSCVRLLERDARWLFDWGESWELDDRGWRVLEEGTPVWLLGEYDFDAPPPWLDPEGPHPPLEVELP